MSMLPRVVVLSARKTLVAARRRDGRILILPEGGHFGEIGRVPRRNSSVIGRPSRRGEDAQYEELVALIKEARRFCEQEPLLMILPPSCLALPASRLRERGVITCSLQQQGRATRRR